MYKSNHSPYNRRRVRCRRCRGHPTSHMERRLHVHRALLFSTLQSPLPFDLQVDLLSRDELVPLCDVLSKQQGLHQH
jgi:hypothetical protein